MQRNSEVVDEASVPKPLPRVVQDEFIGFLKAVTSNIPKDVKDPEVLEKLYARNIAIVKRLRETPPERLFSILKDKEINNEERIKQMRKTIAEVHVSQINLRDWVGNTPLLLAAFYGQTEIAAQLLEARADIHAKNNRGNTALLSGAPHSDMVALLLQKGANPLNTNQANMNALHAAKGSLASIQQLIAAKADINAKNIEGYTPLMEAINSNSPNSGLCVKALIAAGALVNSSDGDGRTPLMLAAFYGQTESAQTLLEARANIHAENERGNNALLLGAPHAGMVDLLLKKGADPHHVNQLKMTALHGVQGSLASIQLLIEAKADLEAEDKKGYTPLMNVAGNRACAKVLIEAGANTHHTNANGLSPFKVELCLKAHDKIMKEYEKIEQAQASAKSLVQVAAKTQRTHPKGYSSFKLQLFLKANEKMKKASPKIEQPEARKLSK